MNLSKLLDGVVVTKMFQTMFGKMVVTHEVEVRNLQYDSRKVERGDLFVAIRGTQFDGHTYISSAVHNGAKVVVMDNDSSMPDSYFMHAGVIKVVVPNTRVALAQIAARYYGEPSSRLSVVGVTGTNGKTTTTHLISAILEARGGSAGLIGTIEYKIGNEVIPSTHTTPESLELNALLARMVAQGCTSAVMEVSSHSLDQHRVHGIGFSAGVFTNLTQDHLDYHGTMDAYFEAKSVLFRSLGPQAWAVINADDAWGRKLPPLTQARVLSFGMTEPADVAADQVDLSMRGTTCVIRHAGEAMSIATPLVGKFNVSNILAAVATGIALGVPKQAIQDAMGAVKPVRGRFEPVVAPEGWTAVIDYAHTPDALEKALNAVHDVFAASERGRIITVFGCGGNRDTTKRPKMAAVATAKSDLTILTSDNPRLEDPEDILRQVSEGVTPGAAVEKITDRKEAILRALGQARPHDVVLIAGKGHEDYQVIGETKIHFSDKEIVQDYISGRR
jgi:UDP-N-acetylmuramoyl-L-alanyl-D-glutamate--2,6-diaminopimelate ligase